MQIYVHRNNQQLGPFTEEQLKAQLADGTLSLQDHAWWQGQTNWVPLSQTPFAATPSPGVPSIPGAVPAIPAFNPPYEKTSNLALWSLICGICSLFCGILFIPAIILGHMGLNETNKNPAIKGRGLALGGMIIGYILFAFYLVMIVIFSVLIALGHTVNGTFKTITDQVQAAPTQDDSDSNSSTNSVDQSTTNAPSDSSTNSTPTITP
jgi:hypothetical protein